MTDIASDRREHEPLAAQIAELRAECERLRIRHEDLAARNRALDNERTSLRRQLVEKEQRVENADRRELIDRLAHTSFGEQELAKRLTDAMATIANMERSRFWKARRAWLRVRALFR